MWRFGVALIVPARIAQESTLSAIGLGMSRIGSFSNPQTPAAACALVQAALDMGVTTFDTANIYGQGDSERTIGRALAGSIRHQAFILTKGGCLFSARMRALRLGKPVLRAILAARHGGSAITARRQGEMRADWRADSLLKSLESSLRRLRTDRVDGFLLHSPPADIAGDPAVHDALRTIRDAGKARHVGISCDSADSLAAALTMPDLGMLELPIDLVAHVGEHGDAIGRRGIIVLAREVIRLRPELSPSAAVQAALGHPLVHCALVGTTRRDHLAEIVGAKA